MPSIRGTGTDTPSNSINRGDLSPWSALAMILAASTCLHAKMYTCRCYTLHAAHCRCSNDLYPVREQTALRRCPNDKATRSVGSLAVISGSAYLLASQHACGYPGSRGGKPGIKDSRCMIAGAIVVCAQGFADVLTQCSLCT